MLLYEVTLQVEPTIALQVETHMIREHIPEIYATRCFERIRFEQASPSRFRTSYEARSDSDLQRYLREHAPRLRAAFSAAFPSGITLTRETWTQLRNWG
jgi:Domain of unknown function (DUF4286)